MQVNASPLRRLESKATELAQATSERVTTALKPAAPTDTTVRFRGVRQLESWNPQPKPAQAGINLRRPAENQTERNMREHPQCFAADPQTGTALPPRSISASNAADRCADGPVREKLWVAGSIAAGALDGALGLKSHPAPGYESEYQRARQTAALQSVIVGFVSGAGAARSAAILTYAGRGVLATTVSAAAVESVATATALVGHASAELVTSAPLEARAVGATSARDAHLPKQAPKKLDGFPDAETARRKTPKQGGGGLRDRWSDRDGSILEWDSRHGTIEKYDCRGRHTGEFDPATGEKLNPAIPGRRIKP